MKVNILIKQRFSIYNMHRNCETYWASRYVTVLLTIDNKTIQYIFIVGASRIYITGILNADKTQAC